jgi:hypothetical protein
MKIIKVELVTDSRYHACYIVGEKVYSKVVKEIKKGKNPAWRVLSNDIKVEFDDGSFKVFHGILYILDYEP